MTLNPDFLPERQVIEVTPDMIDDAYTIHDYLDDYGDFEEPHEFDCTCIFCIPGA